MIAVIAFLIPIGALSTPFDEPLRIEDRTELGVFNATLALEGKLAAKEYSAFTWAIRVIGAACTTRVIPEIPKQEAEQLFVGLVSNRTPRETIRLAGFLRLLATRAVIKEEPGPLATKEEIELGIRMITAQDRNEGLQYLRIYGGLVERTQSTGQQETEPNQPPLRMPVSGTPAADAPVAPPPGIAGR
jgi:hypothetical protein